MNKVKSTITLWSTLIVSLAILSSCGKGKEKEGQTNQVLDYKVLTVTPQGFSLNSTFPATLKGRQSVEIRPKISGYLEAIYVDEGATVKKGQLLFKISSPEYEEAVRNTAAAVRTAEVAVNSAQLDVEKVRPLVEKEIISRYELETAQLTLKAKKASLQQAKADFANAKANQAYTRVTSPANGSIGLIPYKIGSLVSSTSTDPLTSVSDVSTVYAYFSLNEKQLLDFSRKYAGNTLSEKLKKLPKVTLLLSDGSVYPEQGKIEAISGLIDTETGSSSFRAVFPNPVGLLRSGGSATLQIPEQMESVIVIPQSATYELQDKRFVFVVKADNTIESRAIKVVSGDNGQFLVVTDGLKSGEKIVLEGISLLKEGTKIQPKEADAAIIYQGLK